MNNSTKLGRWINALLPAPQKRKGFCNALRCETLDGQPGAACCKLNYVCPILKGYHCKIHRFRPMNCDAFPRSQDDLKLVKNCSYYFE